MQTPKAYTKRLCLYKNNLFILYKFLACAYLLWCHIKAVFESQFPLVFCYWSYLNQLETDVIMVNLLQCEKICQITEKILTIHLSCKHWITYFFSVVLQRKIHVISFFITVLTNQRIKRSKNLLAIIFSWTSYLSKLQCINNRLLCTWYSQSIGYNYTRLSMDSAPIYEPDESLSMKFLW